MTSSRRENEVISLIQTFESQDVFLHEIAVCVGAGIGVTPFASLLKVTAVFMTSLDQR